MTRGDDRDDGQWVAWGPRVRRIIHRPGGSGGCGGRAPPRSSTRLRPSCSAPGPSTTRLYAPAPARLAWPRRCPAPARPARRSSPSRRWRSRYCSTRARCCAGKRSSSATCISTGTRASRLSARVLHEGAWPLWEPGLGFGQPLLADPSVQVLYPVTWLALALPWGLAYTGFVLVHLLVAGLGAARLAARLGAGRAGSWTAGARLHPLGARSVGAQPVAPLRRDRMDALGAARG